MMTATYTLSIFVCVQFMVRDRESKNNSFWFPLLRKMCERFSFVTSKAYIAECKKSTNC